MAPSFSIGRVAGIPVRAHWTLAVLLPWFAWEFAPQELVEQTFRMGAEAWRITGMALAAGVAGALGLFASIVLHEVGHSLVARAKGGRIVDIVLLPIGGVARIANLPRRPRDELLTALAGPGVSLALGLALLAARAGLAAWGARMDWDIPVAALLAIWLLGTLGWTNVALALFNLIPSFPMDGGRVFRAALTPRLGRVRATKTAAIAARVVAVLFALWACRPLLDGGTPRLVLLLIAWFVWRTAGAEARRAEAEASWAALGEER